MRSLTIEPQSKMRENFNIAVGYGEVPGEKRGKHIRWRLLTGEWTLSREEAITQAKKLDKKIREEIRKNPSKMKSLAN